MTTTSAEDPARAGAPSPDSERSLPPREKRGGTRELTWLAAPIVASQLSFTLMAAVDSVLVGRLGASELAAVGLANVWLWTVFALLAGAATGVQIFVSQAHGAGSPERCGRWIWQALYAVVPASLLGVAVVVPLIGPALAAVSESPELIDAATRYAYARLPGEVAMAASMALFSFFRGVGDTLTPLYIGLVANLANFVLDIGLIFGHFGLPELGVVGAGYATSLAHWIEVILSLAALGLPRIRRRFAVRPVLPDLSALRRYARTAGPIGAQWMIGSASFSLFTAMVASFGEASMAASQAVMVLMNVSFMPAYGLSIGVATLSGRYVGAGDLAAVTRSLRSALALGAGICLCVMLGFVSFPEALVGLFATDTAVLAEARPLLLLASGFLFFDAASIIVVGALRGAGDTRFPFLYESVLSWALFLPGAWLLGVWQGGGVLGAWTAGVLYVIVLSGGMLFRFRSGAWRKVTI